MEWVFVHTYMWWIKIENILGVSEPSPTAGPPSIGFQCQEDKPSWTYGCKNQWDGVVEEGLSGISFLKGLQWT